HARLRTAEKAALAALIVGLALLGASARSGRARHVGRPGEWALVAGVALVVVAGAFAARRLHGHRAAIALAACAGLGFGGVGIAAHVLQVPSPLWKIVTEPIALALIAYGVVATLLFATALQRGAVTASSAAMFSVETVVPSLV